jgi:signal transduction histidine kinase
MHDTVIQGCVGVSALLEAAARFQRTNLSEAADLLAQARSQIKETLEEARRAVWNLRHSDGARSPLFDLFDLARNLGREHGASVETQIEGEQSSLDPATDRTLLLVGREALRNAVQHAHAAHISVRVVFESSNVRMEIEDDGVGFDFGRSDLEERNHFGIIGMRERVEQLGGVFELSSNPGTGTLVIAEVPLSSDEGVRRLQNSTIPR